MSISPIEIWMIVGVIFIVIEFSTIPGIGFLFLGLGALTTSALIYFYPNLVDYQVATVALGSFVWFLLLWWPLKVFIYGRKGKAKRDYFDLVGAQVKVFDEVIKPGQMGQVSWSGAIMNARLDDAQQAEKGEALYVTEVKGNVLVCSRDSVSARR